MRAGHFRLNRVLSEPLTALLLKTPLTPNQVTGLSMACGIGAGFLFAGGSWAHSVLGALCYQSAMVLDNCDGEIARKKNLRSAFGAWFDIFADFVTDLSLFLGIAAGCLRQNVEGPVQLFALLCIFGGSMHLVLVILEKIRGFGPAVYENPNPDTEQRRNIIYGVFDALREGESSWFVLIFALLGKAAWLLWFGGIYMQVLWLSALALNFRHLAGRREA